MKKNIIIPVITAVLGLGLGYVIFNSSEKMDEVDHESELMNEHEIWTCSMHPQIRQNEPGACPICGMDLIPLNGSSADNPLILEMSEEAMHLAHVQTTIVKSTSGSNSTISISGKIESDETSSASIVSHIPGRIEKLFVSFTGESIRKGQKIASIYSPVLITAQKELLEAYKMRETQPKLFESSMNKLKYWKITDEQIQEIISSQRIQETFTIYADHSGIVQTRRISVGDHLTQGGVLFDIQDLTNLWAVFDVYEKDLKFAKIGNLIEFTTPALPTDLFTAAVSFVDPVIDSKTRTAKIRVEISNRGDKLKPNMFINGEMFSQSNSSMTISVPKSAVLWTGVRSVVYVKVPELSIPSFEFREVLLGESYGDYYQIISGLVPGEELVTHGAFVIDASAQLNNQSSMMNRLILGAEAENFLPDYTSSTPLIFKQQLEKLDEAYIRLKEAFVMSNLATAKKRSEDMMEVIDEMDMSLLAGEEHNYWMEQFEVIKVSTGHIAGEPDIEKQRKYFSSLSEAIVNSTKVFGIHGEVYYELYCPMANDKAGAYWLSKEKVIRNPYFGEKMLGCGEVKNEIDANFMNMDPSNSQPNSGPQIHNH